MTTKTKIRKMSERGLERRLVNLLQSKPQVRNAGSFEEHGVLTNNRGLVIELENGQEFQVTIVESTRRW